MKQFRWDRVSFWLSVLLWSVLIIQKYIRSQQVHIFAAVMLTILLALRCRSLIRDYRERSANSTNKNL